MKRTRKPTPAQSDATTLQSLKKLSKTAKAAKRASEKENRRRCEELLALITRKKNEIVEAFYDIGDALREILRKQLYQSLKFVSFDELLKERKVMSATRAYKLMKIVEKVPRDTALLLGQEKAFAMVLYTEATPEKDSVDELLKSNAVVGEVPVKKASVREVEKATKSVRDALPKSKAQRAKDKEHRELRKRLTTLLKKHKLHNGTVHTQSDGVTVEWSYEQLAKLPEG